MRILWVSNIPFGPLCEMVGAKKSTGGSWLDAAFNALQFEDNLELIITTVYRVKEIKITKVGNHSFCVLPGGFPSEYDYLSSRNKKKWEEIKYIFSPEVIQIWGTEFTHGYLALQVMKDIPSVIYMQGVMRQIARHYLSGMSSVDLKRSITFRDILKLSWIKQQQFHFLQRSLIEDKMIKLAGNVIVENEWCTAQCKIIDANCNIFKSKLNIKEAFFEEKWSVEKMQPYTIMCNAAGYPIKGLHILLKAFHIVIQKYPDAKLFIPGEKSPFGRSLIEKLKSGGYSKYIKRLIEEFQIKNSIHFLGKLDTAQVALQMAKSNVFVMPSSIENHSSTLIEAMIVGTPCISSYVGGVPEYLNHNFNGLMYRFEEYESLAFNIMKLFANRDLAIKISTNGSKFMRDSRKANNIKDEFISIYQTLLIQNKA